MFELTDEAFARVQPFLPANSRRGKPWRDHRRVLGGIMRLGELSAEEALALERPAMTYVREQLRDRLGRQVWRAWRRWLHPTSGRRPGDNFL